MKKMISCIAILTMLASMVSCGSTDNSGTSENVSKSSTTSSAVTTTADTSKEEKTTAANATEKSKDSAKTDASAKDSGENTLVLNEADRLFGAYVDTQGDVLNLRNEPFPTADIIGTIPDKTQINIYSCGKADWYCTSYNGKSGYVSAKYIKEIESSDQGIGSNVAMINEASAILKSLNDIDMIGGGGAVAVDSSDSKQEGNAVYERVTDSRFTTVEDVKKYITDNICGTLLNRYSSFYEGEEALFKEIDGALYFMQIGRGSGFPYTDDVVVKDVTDTSFTIMAKFDNFGGYSNITVKAVKDNGLWKASSFTVDDGMENAR
ncbi:SH3 domain-containing protein [Ruminococcus sp.]|jgi:uncharacterized protein YraI|uniref:SH3 domain-containing protein n=1 Tax=Ruminococcus sp. TaxID=41978 RepID=UPI0025CCBA07|nr:SH3 domain-containing protein [Ruminococcus sp.]